MRFAGLVAIISEELEEKAIEIAKNAGAGGVTILNGRGLGLEEKKTFLGLTLEGKESILIFVLERKLSLKVLKALHKELDLDKEDRGLAFTVPIEHIAGINKKEVKLFEEEIKDEI